MSMFTLRKLAPMASGVSALLLVIPLAACSSSDSGGDSASPEVTIAVGADASFAPLFLADAEGLFEDAGLNVTLLKTDGGAAPTEAVSAGTAQLAGNAPATVMGPMANSEELRAVAVFQSSGRYLKVVLRDGVDSASEIKNVGVVPGLSLYATDSYLESEGVDPASVNHVTISPADSVTVLQRGDIDAFVLWEPWPTRALDAGGSVVSTTGDYGVSYTQWLVADNSWLTEEPELAKKVVDVIAQACEEIQDDPQPAAEALAKAIQVEASDGLAQIKEIDFAVRDLEQSDIDDATDIGDFLVQQGLMESVPDLDTYVELGWGAAAAS